MHCIKSFDCINRVKVCMSLEKWESQNISLHSWEIHTQAESIVWMEHGEIDWLQFSKGMKQFLVNLISQHTRVCWIWSILRGARLEDDESSFKLEEETSIFFLMLMALL